MRYDICCIGHITLDKVVTPKSTAHMPGGTSFYFSSAIANMDLQYLLVTALAETEWEAVTTLRSKGVEVKLLRSGQTVYFENRYSENPDHRTQRVLQQADPFTEEQLSGVEAKIFHLGPLLAGDIPAELIKALAAKGRVSLDVQGLLRKVENHNVLPIDWIDKKEVLPCIAILKANESEMEVLTGHTDIEEGAKTLSGWGVQEVVITLGSQGSVVYCEGVFHTIPVFHPVGVEDATGCGDTYMAGYLYQRSRGAAIREAGEFAAAMATLKIESSGPFTGIEEEVLAVVKDRKRRMVKA